MTDPTPETPDVLAQAERDEVLLTYATVPEDEDPLDHVGDVLTDEELAAEGLEP